MNIVKALISLADFFSGKSQNIDALRYNALFMSINVVRTLIYILLFFFFEKVFKFVHA